MESHATMEIFSDFEKPTRIDLQALTFTSCSTTASVAGVDFKEDEPLGDDSEDDLWMDECIHAASVRLSNASRPPRHTFRKHRFRKCMDESSAVDEEERTCENWKRRPRDVSDACQTARNRHGPLSRIYEARRWMNESNSDEDANTTEDERCPNGVDQVVIPSGRPQFRRRIHHVR